MAEILEASMLVCFGISWPISLIKNLKARTAKSMSLQFILLIILGYVAGIASKIISHRINYVLLVYLLNLTVVSINLLVYFRNKRLDSQTSASGNANTEVEPMTREAREYTPIERQYMAMNRMAQPGGIVFFGSDFLSQVPVCELAQGFQMTEEVHNRSLARTPLRQAMKMSDVCVTDLAPRKVFINLGDADLADGSLDADEFIANYEWLLYTIHNNCKADIFVLPIFSSSPLAKALNTRLKKLAEECGSSFIDTTPALDALQPSVQFFELIRMYIRCHPITFTEAMRIG